MSKRQEMEKMAVRIWNMSRTELFLSMRFLGPALDALDYRMDVSTLRCGTDALSIRFHPDYVFRTWMAHPYRLNRAYMHMLLHCLFRHMFGAKEHEDAATWDLCCDIAAESVLDGIHADAVFVTPSDLREEWYARLKEELSVLTAERLYEWFRRQKTDPFELERLRAEFLVDDHGFWERMREDVNGQNNGAGSSGQSTDMREKTPDADGKKPDDGQQESPKRPDGMLPPEQIDWENQAKRLQEEIVSEGSGESDRTGSFLRTLRVTLRKRTDYRVWLERFAILREETRIDPDSFDYSYYYYGLSTYGNMPLIEENEFCESRKVESLVIAIDTSASCQRRLVQEFVNETVSILKANENFFQTVDIHIIECDNQVQGVTHITRISEADVWLSGFTISGGYGTDFRPVFRWVEEERNAGRLTGLRGLLYFTDGLGTYPEQATPYETAFVLYGEEAEADAKVPDWAVTLHAPEEAVW